QNQAGVLQVDQAEPAPRLRRSEGWSRHSTLVAVVFRSGLAGKDRANRQGKCHRRRSEQQWNNRVGRDDVSIARVGKNR
ncbi:MAG: hypothetical protein ACKPA9_04690, partial [Microcystis sp.]